MYMRFLLTLLLGAIWLYGCQSEQLPVSSLAARVTEGTSDDRILFRLIADADNPSKDYFEISSENGRLLSAKALEVMLE